MIKDVKSEFVGSVGNWIGISIGCFFLSLIPFIGLPSALCIKQRWIMKNTKYVGMNMEFVGTAGALLEKMFVWGFFFVVTFTIYGLAIPVKYRQWVTQNTVFAPL